MSDARDGAQTSHVLVCLSSSTSNVKVIHAAAKVANAIQGTLTALYVETPSAAQMASEDKNRLRSNMNLAEKLGARLETVTGDDVPYQIAEFARLSNVTCIVIGQTNTVSGFLRRRRSLTDRLVAYAPDLDYYIIPDHGTRIYVARKAKERNPKRLVKDLLISLGTLGLCTLIGFLFSHVGFTDANIIMVYLLGLLLVSMQTDHRVFSLLWAVVSVLLFDLLFTTPRFTFYAYGTGYPVTFLVMFIAAFILSTLAIRLKQNAAQSARSAQRVSVVLETDRQLAKASSRKEILSVLGTQLMHLMNRSLVIFPARKGELEAPSFYPAAEDVTPYQAEAEEEAVKWTFHEGKRSGATTDVFPQADYLYYSLRVQDRIYGVVGIAVHGSSLDASEQSMLLSVIGECSLALENEQNAREKEETRMLAENERLRANLLRAVSHDLRTPLTAILGNADNLISSGNSMQEETRHQLYSDIYDDALWLTGMVENLLSASRMNEDGLNLRMNPELMDDMIAEAAQHMSRRLNGHHLKINKSEQFLFVKADVRLIVQVIINLIDNAVKYTPSGSEIEISSFEQNGKIHVLVSDTGPGIPEEQKEHIFDLFYTGENPSGDNRRGLGIGLALCRSILKAHGGEILAKDNTPKGTVFEMILPREEVMLNE